VLAGLDVVPSIGSNGQARFTVNVNVSDRITSAPVAGQMVVVRAMVNGVPAGSTPSPVGMVSNGAITDTDFCVEASGLSVILPYSQVPDAVPGPFALSNTTNADGDAEIHISLDQVWSGDEVVINVEAIAPPVTRNTCPLPITFTSPGTLAPVGWFMPDTHAHLRSRSFVMP
jgi:hypothetical protein